VVGRMMAARSLQTGLLSSSSAAVTRTGKASQNLHFISIHFIGMCCCVCVCVCVCVWKYIRRRNRADRHSLLFSHSYTTTVASTFNVSLSHSNRPLPIINPGIRRDGMRIKYPPRCKDRMLVKK
jgi:hypothetical protein